MVAGGGGDQRDVGEAFLGARGAEFDGFLWRQVTDDEAVDAVGFAVDYEAGFAVGEDRVVVAHEEDGDGKAFGAGGAHDGEGGGDGDAIEEGNGVGFLDSGAVGNGVGEGEANLNDVWSSSQNGTRGGNAGGWGVNDVGGGSMMGWKGGVPAPPRSMASNTSTVPSQVGYPAVT